jgi:hypothetical protein
VGYPTLWDGTYNGKKSAAGVHHYYYIISAHQSKQILSGAVTAIYWDWVLIDEQLITV